MSKFIESTFINKAIMKLLKHPLIRIAVLEIVIDGYQRNACGIRSALDQSFLYDQERKF